MSGRECRTCGQDGHFARECPDKPSGGGGGGGGCRTCGEEGHYSRDCPQKPSGGGACRSCGEEGHFSRECPTKPSGGGGSTGCRICGEEGHFAKECPNKPPGSSGCHRCGEEGHMARDCPSKKEGEGDVGADGKPRENYAPAEFADGQSVFDDRHQTHSGTGIHFADFRDIPVKSTGENVPPPVTSFREMELRPLINENVGKVGYITPTPIQCHAYPVLAARRDVMACAQTGSGKSCAFLLPILNELMSDPDITPPSTSPATPEALILAPTRELAVQICQEGHLYGQGSMVKTRVIYGGTTSFAQRNQIHSHCNILVATPGRLLQFLNEGHVVLDKLRYFILDEADRMLDMGFMGDVEKIVAKMPPKGARVSGMFSATFPAAIQVAAKDFLNDYIFITVGIVGGACKDVEQTFLQVDKKEKRNKVVELLEGLDKTEKVLVFCASKKGADFLAGSLASKKFSVTSIHGDRLQSQRELALREFTRGDRQILVATAVAARGLDIPKVTLVINYDLPSEIEEYVHRIGRTGRVGNLGRAISFFDVTTDAGIAGALKGILADAGQKVPEWIGDAGGGFDFGDGDFGGVDNRIDGGGAAPQANGGVDEDDW